MPFRIEGTSNVKDDKLAQFLTSTVDVGVRCVPGIGPAAEKALLEAGVSTTFQLIGHFLTLKAKDMDTQVRRAPCRAPPAAGRGAGRGCGSRVPGS